MRNPMLPLSPTSNDSSLRHKPTLAPAGLDRCSRPVAVPEQVRFQAVDAAKVDDCVGWISAGPLSVGSTQERISRRACFLLSTEDQGAVGRDLGSYCLQLQTAGVHLRG